MQRAPTMPASPWYANAPLSMAHLCELDTPPAALISLAAKAGIATVGLRIAPASPGGLAYPLPSATEQADVRQRCRDTGVAVLHIELISITEATVPADFRRMLETGAAIGATRVVAAGDTDNFDIVAEKLAAICDFAQPLGLAVDLEFMPFRGVRSLADAVHVVNACGRLNAHILVDALHIIRSGTPLEDLRRLDPHLVGTFHICDGPLAAPSDLVAEARTQRQTPGVGAFPLFAMLNALPAGTAIGVEVPLPPQFPTLSRVERMKKLATDTRRFLSQGQAV